MLNEINGSEESEVSSQNEPRDATRDGMLIVVSSPSGGGKGTLVKHAMRTLENLVHSVSWTTRAPRTGEINNRDYHFTTPEHFAQMRERGEFLEWAHVHNNLYGTSWSGLEARAHGSDIILEIDVQGAASVRERIKDSVSIFILPPSFEVLRERLTRRASENPFDLTLRLSNSRTEVEHYREFDYVILNDEVERAATQLACIITAERARRARQELLAQQILTTFV